MSRPRYPHVDRNIETDRQALLSHLLRVFGAAASLPVWSLLPRFRHHVTARVVAQAVIQAVRIATADVPTVMTGSVVSVLLAIRLGNLSISESQFPGLAISSPAALPVIPARAAKDLGGRELLLAAMPIVAPIMSEVGHTMIRDPLSKTVQTVISMMPMEAITAGCIWLFHSTVWYMAWSAMTSRGWGEQPGDLSWVCFITDSTRSSLGWSRLPLAAGTVGYCLAHY